MAPFTQMKDYLEEDPVIIERGEGRKLYDVNGNEYWDGVSSIMVKCSRTSSTGIR